VRNLKELNKYSQIDYWPFDPRQKRTEGTLKAQDGSIFRISKVELVVLSANRLLLIAPDVG
jgi:hypothetical protein